MIPFTVIASDPIFGVSFYFVDAEDIAMARSQVNAALDPGEEIVIEAIFYGRHEPICDRAVAITYL